MIQPHRLPIDKPVVQAPVPAWFYQCFIPIGFALSVDEMDRVWTAYLRLRPDLPQNKKPDFEIGAV
jgi:hypothetical protein